MTNEKNIEMRADNKTITTLLNTLSELNTIDGGYAPEAADLMKSIGHTIAKIQQRTETTENEELLASGSVI